MNKSYNILALGGTGTLSTTVVQMSIEQGHRVTVFNRGNHSNPFGAELVKGDFTKDADLIALATHHYDVIIDFLSRTPSDIERTYRILGNSCTQYIFISSACVYRRGKSDFPIRESSPKPNPDWNYNVDKYDAERTLIELSAQKTSTYTIVRPYITYDNNRIPLGIAPTYDYHKTIVERFKSNKPWFVWNDGKALSTVTYVSDFAKGLIGLYCNPKAKNEDFHIVGDFTYTQLEIVETLKKKLHSRSEVVCIPSAEIANFLPEYAPMLKGDRTLDAVFDNSKIKNAVPGLTFDFDLEKGLDLVIDNWEHSKDVLIDYRFDARIDRMLSTYKSHCRFTNYGGKGDSKLPAYLVYRHFDLRYASKIAKILKL